jgi:hypothetical protein
MSIYKKKFITFPNSAARQLCCHPVHARNPSTSAFSNLQVAFSNSQVTSRFIEYYKCPTRIESTPPPPCYILSIFLHTSHTLFCREVHNPNSRSRCCLAGKRTQNLRAILLLNVAPAPLSFLNIFCVKFVLDLLGVK